jgi:hypothetical protein
LCQELLLRQSCVPKPQRLRHPTAAHWKEYTTTTVDIIRIVATIDIMRIALTDMVIGDIIENAKIYCGNLPNPRDRGPHSRSAAVFGTHRGARQEANRGPRARWSKRRRQRCRHRGCLHRRFLDFDTAIEVRGTSRPSAYRWMLLVGAGSALPLIGAFQHCVSEIVGRHNGFIAHRLGNTVLVLFRVRLRPCPSRGTEGSNPSPSSGESVTKLGSEMFSFPAPAVMWRAPSGR